MYQCDDNTFQQKLQYNSANDPIDYNIVGQERDGTFLLTWPIFDQTFFGINKLFEQTIQTVHTTNLQNGTIVVHASLSQNGHYFAYVTKDFCDQTLNNYYNLNLLHLSNSKPIPLSVSEDECFERSDCQTFIQFLYNKKASTTDTSRFLIMRHNKYIFLCEICDKNAITYQKILNGFFWAQWEPINQTLFYVHIRDSNSLEYFYENFNPIMSSIQFHSKLPYEHVLNITLNIPDFSKDTGTDIYEDDIIPLRIHDTSLDLEIVSNKSGMLFICHHYFFQENKKSLIDDDNKLVKFAYSITPLHHNCIIHCTFSDMQWCSIRNIKPTYKIYEDNFLLVFLPGLFVHLLDIGLRHEPCCHIITKIDLCKQEFYDVRLVSILGYGKDATLDLNTFNIIKLTITENDLLTTFKQDENLYNKLSIIHYLMYHKKQYSKVIELLEQLTTNYIHKDYAHILQEFLTCGTFETIEKTLPNDAKILINLLPMTTVPIKNNCELYIDDELTLNMTQRTLRYTSMMLISPQQRLVPYMQDIWTNLWDNLTFSEKSKPRFSSSLVVDKLALSLVCYQPEALSKCTTPLSPIRNANINDTLPKTNHDFPFYEIESCTANKQEHVLSVNLRELSMYLLKYGSGNYGHKKFQWQLQTPTYIHAVATRYTQTLLDQSRTLCQLLCRFSSINSKLNWTEKGFTFINHLNWNKRNSLFMLFERYYLAIESLAYPLPNGFMPFFTYLGYRSLPFSIFFEYANRKVFDLQIDVMKMIINDTNRKCTINDKLQLVTIMPKSRATRILNQWNNATSILIRSKAYTRSILEGSQGQNNKRPSTIQNNIPTKIDNGTFMPFLDSLLNMLTAKASLADLDFSLIIESVMVIMRNLEHNQQNHKLT